MMQISGYSQIEQIGQGGLGDVYRARHDSTDTTVAIKVLRDVSDESVAWHRTRRELTALVSLAGHAHVVRLIEVLDAADGPALVMEYAPGGSVADLMARRDAPIAVVDAVLIGRHTAAALAAAHEQGIVHRDVKPQNLLIDAYGQVKLCDFGIAAMARSHEFQHRTSALSMRYASPEELDERDVGPAADVYSLAATLLHVSRGAPPTLRERLAPWEPPCTDDEDLAALDAVMARCLHPSPDARPSAAEVLSDLELIGWSIDERHRALVFEPVDLCVSDRRPNGELARRPPLTIGDATVVRGAGGSGRYAVQSTPAVAPPAIDPTVHRDAAPRDLVRPRPRAARLRRWPFAIGTLVILAAAMGVWLLPRGAGVSDAQRSLEPSNTVLLTARPAGLEPSDSLIWPQGPVGECLVQVDDAFEPIDCAEPHDLQRSAAGELGSVAFAADTPFDVEAVHRAVAATCDEVFERFVGVAPASSSLMAPFTAPSASTYGTGDRSFQCWVGLPDQRVIGDASGSGA